jgi:hypothetical protein
LKTSYHEKHIHIFVTKNIRGYPGKYCLKSYDLKGAEINRYAPAGESTLLDGDFINSREDICLPVAVYNKVVGQIKADVLLVLENNNIVDYSFFISWINRKSYEEDHPEEIGKKTFYRV